MLFTNRHLVQYKNKALTPQSMSPIHLEERRMMENVTRKNLPGTLNNCIVVYC